MLSNKYDFCAQCGDTTSGPVKGILWQTIQLNSLGFAMNDIIFRAFQLAREGCYRNIRHLEIALAKEGYDQAQLHLSGSLIRKQLYAIIKAKA